MCVIHNRLKSSVKSRSEVALYDTVVSLDNSWHAWFNQKLNFMSEEDGAVNREVDCVLYSVDHGMVVVECKDGKISRHLRYGASDGELVWFQNTHEMEWSPAEQAGSLTPTLHNKFQQILSTMCGSVKRRVRVQWAVCLADMETIEGLPQNELPKKRVILKQDLGNVRNFEKQLIKILSIPEASYNNTPFPNDVLSEDEFRQVCNLFEGGDEPTLPEVWDIQNRARLEPTLMQEMLMESMVRNKQICVEGVAGSGKSLMLQWEARRLAELEKRVAVVCYNDLLAKYLTNYFKEAKLSKLVEVHSLADWGKLYDRRMNGGEGVSHKEPKDNLQKQKYYDELLPKALLNACKKMTKDKKMREQYLFDALLIDEGQDFQKLWIEAVLGLLKKQENAFIRFFYDSRQCLYNRDGYSHEFIRNLPVLVLSRGFRSTKKISEWVEKITGIPVPCYSSTPNGDRVEEVFYKKPEEQENLLLKTIVKLTNRGVRLSDIMVVSLRSMNNSGLKNMQDERLAWSTVGNKDLRKDKINIVSVKRSKGLDASVVILTDVPKSKAKFNMPHDKGPLILVGATRAKEKLIVFMEK